MMRLMKRCGTTSQRSSLPRITGARQRRTKKATLSTEQVRMIDVASPEMIIGLETITKATTKATTMGEIDEEGVDTGAEVAAVDVEASIETEITRADNIGATTIEEDNNNIEHLTTITTIIDSPVSSLHTTRRRSQSFEIKIACYEFYNLEINLQKYLSLINQNS